METKSISKKICFFGDVAVGKTSLIRRFVHNVFDDWYIVTFGTKVSSKELSFVMGDTQYQVYLAIWDIVGQREYRKLHKSYFQGASGGFAVCDITREDTLNSVDFWVTEFQKVSGLVPIMLLANKIDLEDRIRFGDEELSAVAEKYQTQYVTTSAKTGENVEDAFKLLTELMLDADIHRRTGLKDNLV